MSRREEFLKLQAQLDKAVAKKEKGIISDYKDALDELRAMMATVYAKYEIAGALIFSEMMKYGRAAKLDKEIQAILKDLSGKNAKNTRDIMKLAYEESFEFTKNMIEVATDRKIPGVVTQGALERAVENPVKGLRLNRTLEKNRINIIYTVQQTVEQGIQNGDTYGQMAGRLKDSLENDLPKALRIVRTETHRVMEQAKLDSLDQAHNAGVKMVKQWVSARDERVRSSHDYMDGVIVDYDEDFVNPLTGGRGAAPGVMGTAADDINCRCVFIIDFVDGGNVDGLSDVGYNNNSLNLQLFAEEDLTKQKTSSVRRGIKSLEKRIAEHEDKINNPRSYVEGWNSLSKNRQEGLKLHWQKEIDSFNVSIDNRIKELRKRGEYNEG